jgi:Na+/glutamate symporter
MLGCFDSKDCTGGGDLSNIAATYIGIIIGAIIGAIISWWIYNRQQKTADEQEKILKQIEELEEKNERILEKVQIFEQNHDEMLKNIIILEKKINCLLDHK